MFLGMDTGFRMDPYVWDDKLSPYTSAMGDVLLPITRPIRRQQGRTCTVNAVLQAIELQSDMAGRPIPRLSAEWLSWLVGDAVGPFQLAEAILKYGVAADTAKPPFDKMDGKVHPISTHLRPVNLHASLNAGRFPVVGLVIDGRWPKKPLINDTRHAVVVTGRRPGEWRILNSEGSEWGDNGQMWIDDEWMSWHCCPREFELSNAY